MARVRVVITGASRGIGLEFARQYAARGDQVEAAARTPDAAVGLAAVAARYPALVRVHACDVASDASVRAFADALGGESVDVLINNAGVMGKLTSLEALDFDDVLRTFNINAVGALRVTCALLPHLRRGRTRKIVHISSGMGSIADDTTGGAYAYRLSKAALNMAARNIAVDLRTEGFVSVVINPGWVKTDMGGDHAPTRVEDSVAAMVRLIDGLTTAQSGSFLDRRGGIYPW